MPGTLAQACSGKQPVRRATVAQSASKMHVASGNYCTMTYYDPAAGLPRCKGEPSETPSLLTGHRLGKTRYSLLWSRSASGRPANFSAQVTLPFWMSFHFFAHICNDMHECIVELP